MGVDKTETLKSHLTVSPDEPFDDGTVIKFKIRHFEFAVIRTGGLWYATGRGSLFPAQGLAYSVLVRRLIDKGAMNIKWTDEWKDVT